MEDQEFYVHMSPSEIRCRRPDGHTEVVHKSDLLAVAIEPAGAAPVACDHLWVLADRDGGCVVPQGAYGEAALVDYLKSLPGFDFHAVLSARRSAAPARTVCWQRH